MRYFICYFFRFANSNFFAIVCVCWNLIYVRMLEVCASIRYGYRKARPQTCFNHKIYAFNHNSQNHPKIKYSPPAYTNFHQVQIRTCDLRKNDWCFFIRVWSYQSKTWRIRTEKLSLREFSSISGKRGKPYFPYFRTRENFYSI